jgi:hypothetical protein
LEALEQLAQLIEVVMVEIQFLIQVEVKELRCSLQQVVEVVDNLLLTQL